jgi:2,4-dienoyl-CoA reductase-like NADH-dependent reductase (Old Yellow Enzyme family)
VGRSPQTRAPGPQPRHRRFLSTIRWPVPQALDEAGVARFRDAHANADSLGFDLVEWLAAHRFLLHSFLSPIANRPIDSYGGSLASRMRYPLEGAAATRDAWPRRKPPDMRTTGCDWLRGGITTDEASVVASELRAIGFDCVCVSSGGISPQARPAGAPGYQVPLATAALGADAVYPPQYRRAHPEYWPGGSGLGNDPPLLANPCGKSGVAAVGHGELPSPS